MGSNSRSPRTVIKLKIDYLRIKDLLPKSKIGDRKSSIKNCHFETAFRLAADAWMTDSEMSIGPVAPPQR